MRQSPPVDRRIPPMSEARRQEIAHQDPAASHALPRRESPQHRSRAGKELHRLTLDIPKALYKRLAQRALDDDTSLLELCERWLSERLEASP